jgi:uncharacterized Fe-S cluster-containing radical SAM superfamily protein
MHIDPVKRAFELRKTLKKEDKVLVTDFSGTLQGKDTSRVIDLMPNVSTGEYVFRTKVNVKEIDPLAVDVYGKDFFDITKKSDKEIEDFLKTREFDFPLWFKHHQDFSMQKVRDYNTPFILQVAGCNFHDGSSSGGCWYCFVDDKSNNGIVENGKTFLSTADTIDSMLSARDKIKNAYPTNAPHIRVLRTSGGEPTLALDWILDLWREVEKRGLDFVGQIDSNLSTGRVVEEFEKQGVYEENILEKLAQYPIKVLTALKGSDNNNLESNVQSTQTLETQKRSLKRILKAGFDIYPQMYNPKPETLEGFLGELDSEVENLSLRIHIGPLKVYGPTKARLSIEAMRQGKNAEEFLKEKQTEWDGNYANSCEVLDKYLRERYGVGYKETTRSDVKLKLLK